jgi:hypothetical protein
MDRVIIISASYLNTTIFIGNLFFFKHSAVLPFLEQFLDLGSPTGGVESNICKKPPKSDMKVFYLISPHKKK